MMNRKRQTILMIMFLLVVWLWVVLYLIMLNNRSKCEMEYENCMKEREAWMKVICFPCKNRILYLR